MFKPKYEPTFVPMSSEKIRTTVGRLLIMSTEDILQFRASIADNIRTMRTLGGYNRLQLDEHQEWMNLLGKLSWSIYHHEQIDWEKMETRLIINSCIRKLQMTDSAFQAPILKELDEADAHWMNLTQGTLSEYWHTLLNT